MAELPAYASAEKQADKFAAAFLMPEWLVHEFGSAEELRDACKVSMKAAQIRYEIYGNKNDNELPDIVKTYLKDRNG